jgi:hypothetical protein
MNTSYAPGSFVSRLSGFVLKVLLGAAAAVFALSLLLAGAIAGGVVLVVSLLAGRKPAALVFPRGTRDQAGTRFRDGAGRFGRGGAAWGGFKPVPVKADDVVDVQSRDIR